MASSDEAVWLAAHQQVTGRRGGRVHTKVQALLTGLARCPGCGGAQSAKSYAQRGHVYHRYRCASSREDCPYKNKSYNVAATDKAAWNSFSTAIQCSDALRTAAERSKQDDTAQSWEAQLAQAESKLSANKQEQRAVMRWLGEPEAQEEADRRLQELIGEAKHWSRLKEEAERGIQQRERQQELLATLDSKLEALRARVREATFEEQRELMSMFSRRGRGSITIEPTKTVVMSSSFLGMGVLPNCSAPLGHTPGYADERGGGEMRTAVGLGVLLACGCEPKDGGSLGDVLDGVGWVDYPDYVDGPDWPPDAWADYVDYADWDDGYDGWYDVYYDGWYDIYYEDYWYDGPDYVDWADGPWHSGESGETGQTGQTGETGLAFPGVDQLQPGELVITEIMHNPSAVADPSGEWFEVLNASALTVDLDGLVVRDQAGIEQFVVAGSLVVSPLDRVVFGTQGDPALNGGVPVDIVYLASDFTLANGADQILLENGNGLLDAVAYDDGLTFPDVDGASMSLDPVFTDAASNDLGSSWCAASQAYGAGDRGSPGAPNPSCPGFGTGDTGLSLPAEEISPGELVITEILNNPDAVLDTRGEWFEVRNVSARALDLEGLVVGNAAGTESFTVMGALPVPAGGYVVLGIEADPALNGGVTLDYAYAAFSLGNGPDEIVLSNSAGALDAVAWDGGTSFPSPVGASLSLDPAATDAASNDDGTSWCEAQSPFGAGDRGTPGASNDPC